MTCNHTPGMWCVHLNSLIFLWWTSCHMLWISSCKDALVDLAPTMECICGRHPTYSSPHYWFQDESLLWIASHQKNSCCAAYILIKALCWPLGTLCHYIICSETKQCGFLPLCWGCGDTTAACIMCSGLATQPSTLHSNATSSLQDVTPIHTPTYVWSSNACYWYLVRQKKQRSSNRITYRIAGNFRGRTFQKLVERRSC